MSWYWWKFDEYEYLSDRYWILVSVSVPACLFPCFAIADLHQRPELTGKDGAELGPAGDPSFRGVLAQRHFQEEDRESTTEQEDEVRDQKCSCVTETGNGSGLG